MAAVGGAATVAADEQFAAALKTSGDQFECRANVARARD